jgi:hypothetical protein
MGWLATFGLMMVPACFALAGIGDGGVLDYQLKVQRRADSAWVESRFRVVTMPPLTTRQRLKHRRLGRWRIEAVAGPGGPPDAAMLAQAASLMFLAGPTPDLIPKPSGVVLGKRFCRLWQAPSLPGVAAYVYLAEVAPDLLALSYLSVSFKDGDLAALELHLRGVNLGAHPYPVEDGTVLLRTLDRWNAARPVEVGKGGQGQPAEWIE